VVVIVMVVTEAVEVVSTEITIMTVEAIVMVVTEVAEVVSTEIITMIEDSNLKITNKVMTKLTFWMMDQANNNLKKNSEMMIQKTTY